MAEIKKSKSYALILSEDELDVIEKSLDDYWHKPTLDGKQVRTSLSLRETINKALEDDR